MKKGKKSYTLCYIASVLFYLAAAISFVGGTHNSMAVGNLCLGSVFLCLGTVYKKKETEDENDNTQE